MCFWCFGCCRRIRKLEEEIRELKKNTVLDLDGKVSLEEAENCSTVVFSGVNVQIVNGEGGTGTTNGCGNLVVGYNELGDSHSDPDRRSGSHNLVVGPGHNWKSYGGLLAGANNTILGNHCSILGGQQNHAHSTANYSVIVSGFDNKTNSLGSCITSGFDNATYGEYASVTAGQSNRPHGNYASILGGSAQELHGDGATIPPIP